MAQTNKTGVCGSLTIDLYKRPLPFMIQFDETSQSGNILSADDLRKKCMEIWFKKDTTALNNCNNELQSRNKK
jgi:hypothetical protein